MNTSYACRIRGSTSNRLQPESEGTLPTVGGGSAEGASACSEMEQQDAVPVPDIVVSAAVDNEECHGGSGTSPETTDLASKVCHRGVELPTTPSDSSSVSKQPGVASVSTSTCVGDLQLGCSGRQSRERRGRSWRGVRERILRWLCAEALRWNLRGYRFVDGILMHSVLSSKDEECVRIVLPKCERDSVFWNWLTRRVGIWVQRRFGPC